MENYRICSEVITLPQPDPPGSISNLVSLTNNRIWIYFHSGICQYWDLFDFSLKAPKLLNSMKIPSGIYHSFAVSAEKIAYYDHFAQRLRVIRLKENKIDSNFWTMLPTNNTVGNNERNDEKKIEEICRDYTKFVAFVNTETIVSLEKTLTNSNNSDSVISVFRESSCPEPFKQMIHNSNTSAMGTLNSDDTIVIYQPTLEKTHIFFIWNVFSDEKSMRKIIIKNDISGTAIKATSYSLGTLAVWMNVNHKGSPELGIVNYLDQEKEKKESEGLCEYFMDRYPLDSFPGDWILGDVLFYDQKRNLMFLSKFSDSHTLELMSTRTRKSFFSKGPENSPDDDLDPSQAVSLDMKYFVDYEYTLAEETNDEEEAVVNDKHVKVIMNNIVPLRVSLLSILEKKKVLEKFGSFLTNEIIDMLTLEGKEGEGK